MSKNELRNNKSLPLIMGILNVTPDSFSDGGKFLDRDLAVVKAITMISEGADIIDIGGESTRPGSVSVSPSEQIDRIVPVIEKLSERVGVPISVDTASAEVFAAAHQAGASILNDISALEDDPAMANLAAETDCQVILMHKKGRPLDMQNNPVYDDVVNEVYAYLAQRIEFALSAGIKKDKIIIDPGIGFGKTVDHNLQLVKNIDKFNSLGVRVLLAASRKTFIGKVLDIDSPVERIYGDTAVIAYAAVKGVNMLRVHEVAAASQIIKMIQAIMDC